MFGKDNSNRKPASLLRTGTEAGILGSLGTVLAWAIPTFFPEAAAIPPPVQLAALTAFMGIGSTILSFLRNRGKGGALTGANKD